MAIAAALKAVPGHIYTDVDGVYTADPRIVKDAKKLDEITYDEMLGACDPGRPGAAPIARWKWPKNTMLT